MSSYQRLFIRPSKNPYSLRPKWKWRDKKDQLFFWLDAFVNCKYEYLREIIAKQYILPISESIVRANLPHIRGFSNEVTPEHVTNAKNANSALFLDHHKVGNKGWAVCPFHKDTKPSLCLYEGDKGFYCFSCGEGGDAIKLVMQTREVSFPEAVRYINSCQ